MGANLPAAPNPAQAPPIVFYTTPKMRNFAKGLRRELRTAVSRGIYSEIILKKEASIYDRLVSEMNALTEATELLVGSDDFKDKCKETTKLLVDTVDFDGELAHHREIVVYKWRASRSLIFGPFTT